MKLRGDVEVDESCFGSRSKYNRGQKRGMKVWIVGLVERSSNRIILYPVDNRNAMTLTTIIKRHVEPGSNVYSDGWAGYNDLNMLGFRHFTVVHKYCYKQQYFDTTTGEVLTVHTNRIEGAWKHAKDYFKRMNGSNMKNFESHLANIVMKNHNTGRNRYVGFFDILQSIYNLQGPAVYTYSHPVFDTWSPVDASDSLGDAMSYSIHRFESDEDDVETAINTPEIVPVLVEHPLHPNVAVRRRQVHAPSSTITRPEPSGDGGHQY